MAKVTLKFTPKIVDLVLYAGDEPRFRLTFTDLAGAAVPLTGTMRAQIRENRDDAVAEATFDVDLTAADAGLVVISMDSTQTQNLVSVEKFVGAWDLEWTPDGSGPVTLCQGKVECFPDVTR